MGTTSFILFVKCYLLSYFPDHLIIIALLSLLIKLPVYGVHFWLPKVHVESPTRGRIVLAGVFLKLGAMGVIRILNYF